MASTGFAARLTDFALDFLGSALPSGSGYEAGASGVWTEGGHNASVIELLIEQAGKALPECKFAVVSFNSATQALFQAVFSKNVPADQTSLWSAALRSTDFFSLSGVEVDGDIADLSGSKMAEAMGADKVAVKTGRPLPRAGITLAVWREEQYGDFQEPDLEIVKELYRLVTTAMVLRAGYEAEMERRFGQMLDQIGVGFITADRTLTINAANSTALQSLGDKEYFHREGEKLAIADSMARTRLERSIDHINQPGEHAGGVVVPLAGRNGQISRISLTPMHNSILLGPPRFALVINDQRGGAPAVSYDQLRSLGLTNAEALLARGLLDGSTVTDYANSKGIAVATARAHLKRMMLRLGVHRQADLIRKLMSIS